MTQADSAHKALDAVHNALFKPVVANFFTVTLFLYGEDLAGGLIPLPRVPSPLDIRFQRVSGLGGRLNVTSHYQGGDNVSAVDLPDTIQRDRLVMERGIMAVTPLSGAFERMLNDGQVFRSDIIIMLWSSPGIPVATWAIMGAIPVQWSMGEFDANASQIALNRFEFSYQRIKHIGISL